MAIVFLSAIFSTRRGKRSPSLLFDTAFASHLCNFFRQTRLESATTSRKIFFRLILCDIAWRLDGRIATYMIFCMSLECDVQPLELAATSFDSFAAGPGSSFHFILAR